MEDFINKKIFIRTHDGGYIRANDKDAFDVSTGGGAWETFTLKDRGDGNYALQTAHGDYMKAHPGKAAKVEHEDYIGGWEVFSFQEEEGGVWAIKTAHETFISVNRKGKIDTEMGVGETEKFTIESADDVPIDLSAYGDLIALKSTHGTYVRAQDRKHRVDASDGVGAWESFTMAPLDGDGHAYLKTAHGSFLRANDKNDIDHDSEEPGEWEKFKFIQRGNGCALRTCHGGFVSCDNRSRINVKGSAGAWETFEIVEGVE